MVRLGVCVCVTHCVLCLLFGRHFLNCEKRNTIQSNFFFSGENLIIKSTKICLLFFLLLFTDAEDDRVTIANELDFTIFKESGFNRMFVTFSSDDLVNRSTADASIKSPSPLPVTALRAEPLYSPAAGHKHSTMPLAAMKPFIHPNVICDECEDDIVGIRYMCLDCFNFDLCMNCEAQMMHNHHVMIRIVDPRTFDSNRLEFFCKRLGRQREVDYRELIEDLAIEEKIARRGNNLESVTTKRFGKGKRYISLVWVIYCCALKTRFLRIGFFFHSPNNVFPFDI